MRNICTVTGPFEPCHLPSYMLKVGFLHEYSDNPASRPWKYEEKRVHAILSRTEDGIKQRTLSNFFIQNDNLIQKGDLSYLEIRRIRQTFEGFGWNINPITLLLYLHLCLLAAVLARNTLTWFLFF